jgi:hypothetical protein
MPVLVQPTQRRHRLSLRATLRRSLVLAIPAVLAASATGAAQAAPSALDGYITSEVEADVWRVDSDGVRELAQPLDQLPPRAGIQAGRDGSVWLLARGALTELGGDVVGLPRELRPRGGGFARAARSEDGRLWWTGRGLHVFDGAEWTTVRDEPGRGVIADVRIAPDGTVWVTWSQGRRSRVGRIGADGWSGLPGSASGFAARVGFSSDGPLLSTGADGAVWRHDGSDWNRLKLPGGELQAAAFGADGTTWVRLARDADETAGSGSVLARRDGDGWRIFKGAHRIPASGSALTGFGTHEVGPDGVLWFPARDRDAGPVGDCDGLGRFDGRAMRWFLRDHCVHDISIGPDGGVWLIASREGEPDGGELTEVGPIQVFYLPPDA